MKFIDLFAGLGGFHLALKELGHECVFASEINESLCEIYYKNFGLKPQGDIRQIKVSQIPRHDILCAGFPCTPFSKAGKLEGRKDKKQGDLFDEIVRILEYHKPSFFILENVPNLFSHDDSKTWKYIKSRLTQKLTYNIDKNFYSPNEFGIPQNRKRMFIVGSKKTLSDFTWIDEFKVNAPTHIKTILDKSKNSYKKINTKQKECINLWQGFLDAIPKDENLGYPIWATEFGATYPFEHKTPFKIPAYELSKKKGSFGISLKGLTKREILNSLPSYARTQEYQFPEWKKRFIRENRKLYKKYENKLIPIMNKISTLEVPSWQKFEWNCQDEPRTIKNYILQFRASGLRVKKPDTAPSLVCPSTQIPIIGWENRYISKYEALKLHSMGKIKNLPQNNTACYRALGNAVNVKIVSLIAKKLIK